jgi:hypothetical protein
MRYFRNDRRVMSIMIEVNRLDETTGKPGKRFGHMITDGFKVIVPSAMMQALHDCPRITEGRRDQTIVYRIAGSWLRPLRKNDAGTVVARLKNGRVAVVTHEDLGLPSKEFEKKFAGTRFTRWEWHIVDGGLEKAAAEMKEYIEQQSGHTVTVEIGGKGGYTTSIVVTPDPPEPADVGMGPDLLSKDELIAAGWKDRQIDAELEASGPVTGPSSSPPGGAGVKLTIVIVPTTKHVILISRRAHDWRRS